MHSKTESLETRLRHEVVALGKTILADVQNARNNDTISIKHKDGNPNQITTQFDERSHQELYKILTELTPGIPIISEEDDKAERASKRAQRPTRYWVIDPIDATRALAGGMSHWAIQVALVEQGVPTIGVVYLPEKHLCYYTESGAAFRKNAEGKKQINIIPVAKEAKANLHFRSHLPDVNKRLEPRVKFQYATDKKFAGKPAQSEISLLDGTSDIHIGGSSWSAPKEWDIAPFMAMVRQAGGEIYHADANGRLKPFRLTNEDEPPKPLYWAHPKTMKQLGLISQHAAESPLSGSSRSL